MRIVSRREISVALAIGGLWFVLGLVAPGFFKPANLRDVLMSNVAVLIAALGMTLIVVVGQIDISIGSAFALCSVAAGLLAKSGWPWEAVAAATFCLGGLLGVVNGTLVAYAGIPSIVVTLASMTALRDGLRWATQGAWVQDLPRSFQWFGWSLAGSQAVTAGVAALLSAGLAWGLHHLVAGRAVYAVGSNEEAARLAGLDRRSVTFWTFAAAGALTGCAALLNAVRFNQIPSNAGLGMEMKVIAAVVVGGASIRGGRGTVAGTLLGVILLATIGTALTFLGVSASWERAIQGAIILAAVGAEAWPMGAHTWGGRLGRGYA